jgi:hypothetical protein
MPQEGTTYGTRFRFRDTGQRLLAGAGSPEGAVVGTTGDIYFRSDGVVSTTIYIKVSGTDSTTLWSPIVSA